MSVRAGPYTTNVCSEAHVTLHTFRFELDPNPEQPSDARATTSSWTSDCAVTVTS
jgi:hypothetical protein